MKAERLVYEYENKQHYKCAIFELDDCYEVRTGKHKAQFDKRESVLDSVVQVIEEYGIPQANESRKMGFRIVRRNKETRRWEHIMPLARVIMASYMNVPVEELHRRRLCYSDGNEFNLRKSNLRLASQCLVDTIKIGGYKYIRIRYGQDKSIVAITNYDDGLYQLIRRLSWRFERTCKGFYCREFGKRKIALHQVVWCFYHGGVTRETLWQRVGDIYEDGYVIDHKRSGPKANPRWDNRIENLQMILERMNRIKNNCTAKMSDHTFYIPVSDGAVYGKYDIKNQNITYYHENKGFEQDDAIGLQHLCKTGEFSQGVEYRSVRFDSNVGRDIILADLRESKLYQGVYNL